MFTATAATPVAGTPPRPSTGTSTVCPAPTCPIPFDAPSIVDAPARVSSRRAGTSAVKPSPDETGYQPCTSATTSKDPYWLKIDTRPPSPTLAITRLGWTTSGRGLTLDASGRATPVGNTVR